VTYCADCGSPNVADLDHRAGLWVCDECGLIQPESIAALFGPSPPFADEHPHRPAVTVKPCPRYL
jgi:hypothetical protein